MTTTLCHDQVRPAGLTKALCPGCAKRCDKVCPAHQPYGELSLSMSLDRYGEGEESNFVIYIVYLCSSLSPVLITNTSWLDLATQIREIKTLGGGRYSKSVNLKETLEVGRGVFPSE